MVWFVFEVGRRQPWELEHGFRVRLPPLRPVGVDVFDGAPTAPAPPSIRAAGWLRGAVAPPVPWHPCIFWIFGDDAAYRAGADWAGRCPGPALADSLPPRLSPPGLSAPRRKGRSGQIGFAFARLLSRSSRGSRLTPPGLASVKQVSVLTIDTTCDELWQSTAADPGQPSALANTTADRRAGQRPFHSPLPVRLRSWWRPSRPGQARILAVLSEIDTLPRRERGAAEPQPNICSRRGSDQTR